jgi:catechol 2,3-dioxygenase-like lactoylglutathione lyase family enzyme
MAIDYGRPPKGGFAKQVSELLVEDLRESLYFWREALGFEIAYQRPEQKFAYYRDLRAHKSCCANDPKADGKPRLWKSHMDVV